MYSFGKTPPRSLESFGVAGLLGEGCQVYYESLFSTRHLGRVSDLLSSRLKAAGLDELRLRALMLFSAFEAFRNQHKPAAKAGEVPMAEPLVIECGLDADKIALGVAFTLPENLKLEVNGLAERIGGGHGSGPFEILLQELYRSSDRIVLRFQPGIRRIEVVSLLAIPGKMDPAALQARQPLHLVLLEKAPPGEAPKVAAYVELGDLDYPQLLKDDLPGSNLPPSPTGEVLIQGLTELEKSLHARVAGGAPPQGQDKVKISGVTQNIKDDVIRIKGGSAETQDQTVLRIPAGAGPNEVDKLYQEKIAALEKRIAELEAGAPPAQAAETSEGDGDEEDEESGSSALSEELAARKEQVKGLFKKVWPFKKKGDDDEVPAAEGEGESEGAAKSAAAEAPASAAKAEEAAKAPKAKAEKEPKAPEPAPEEALPAPVSASSAAGGANPEAAAASLMVEIQNGSLDRTITNAQREAADIKKDLSSAKAKRWVDGLMGELVAEKARLAEFTKKLNTQIRQKELEFRNKEQGLLEELRRRDDLLRQKNTALNRTKEQLSQVQLTLERLKQASQAGNDDAHYKQKYNLNQKMLVTVKEENERLTEKIEELKNQLAAAQVNSVKSRGPSVQEFQVLQGKYERALRQAEEFKRANADLLNKFNDTSGKKTGGAGDVAELKKRLEAAMKMATAHQKEAEQQQLKVEELQREEMRLKMELNRTTAELKSIRQKLQPSAPGAVKPGTGTGGTPPNAA